ncbi:MAG: hypothetical protein PF795_08825, partial [Kiritimatiellae bacterium]|nr:hypothetical protein [Kiritimatiellia bacterium]
GHVRPGYRLQELYAISKNGYDIVESQPYGGFFVEFINVWLQVASGSSAPEFASTVKANKGPLDQQELRKFATLFRTHRISYPFQKIAQGLDALFPFTKTHCLVVTAKARPWNERTGVHMRDGRSIADATINTRIGSAANLTDPKNNRSSAS